MTINVADGGVKPRAISSTLSPTDHKILVAKAKSRRVTVSCLIREALYQQGLLDP